MANKETCRTLSKLWLINVCAVIIIFTLHFRPTFASETKEETPQNVTAIENNSTSENPIAEPLVRFRRQPPRTVVKHIIRPKRYKMKRVKRPKIKYSFAEPPTTYYIRKPIMMKKPTFDSSIFEDFAHMNVESADFDLPPSSYEAQSMDLDLYKHYEPSIEAASYKEIKKPSSLYSYTEPDISYNEPSYTEEVKTPAHTYTVPQIAFKDTHKPSVTYSYTEAKPRKPHTKYGVPTEFHYSSSYDRPSDNKYTFEAPAIKPAYTETENPSYKLHNKHEYAYKKLPSKHVPRIPATTYGVPEVHIPATGSNDYNKYSVVEQKPPYASQAPNKKEIYHFAEPPAEPEESVHITYSPSYEINIPPSHKTSYSGGKYQHESHAPEQHVSTEQHTPNNNDEYSYQEQVQYEEPPQQYHPSATQYQPANNYESPAQANYEDTISIYQEVSGTNQPESFQPAPARPHTIDEYIPPSQNLPINVNHKQPAYDYPKSSYEVPIYDPIPFDSSNNQESEIYPPHSSDQAKRQAPPEKQRPPLDQPTPNDINSIGTRLQNPQTNVNRPQSPINHLRRTRKRKRTKGSSTTVSTTKHILDVPELEEAFEKENRNTFTHTQEPDANESQRFENINNQNKINDVYSKGPWNPMKIRTSPIVLMTTASTVPPIKTLATKNKRYHYKQQRTSATAPTTASSTTTSTTTTTTTEPPTKVEIISIDKSRSKSYYDGVLSTPKIYNKNFYKNRFRLGNTSAASFSTPQAHNIKSPEENNFAKRTTKNVFDTTIFKSPFNEMDVIHNLPKNHKLF